MLQHQHGRATPEPDFNQEAEVKAELLHHMTQHLGREPTEAELVNDELILQMSQRLRAYLIHSIQYGFSSPSPDTTPQQSPTAKTEPDEEHDPNVKVNDSSKNSEDVEHDTHGACVSAKTYKSIGLEGKLSANTLPLLLEHHTVRSNGHIHRR